MKEEAADLLTIEVLVASYTPFNWNGSSSLEAIAKHLSCLLLAPKVHNVKTQSELTTHKLQN